MAMSRENVVKLSVAGALFVVALVLTIVFGFGGPRVKVDKSAPVPEPGSPQSNTRGPSADY